MLSSILSLAALLPLLVAGSPASLASRSLVARQDPVVFDTVTVFVTPLESLEGVVPLLPKDQNLVLVPRDEKLQQFVVGRGFQNYTCGPDFKYVSAGAVADLYDISPWTSLPGYELFLSAFFLKEIPFPSTRTDPKFSAVGSHFFISRDGGIAPLFEFKEALKDQTKFVVGKKTGEIDDVLDAKKNIKWLQFTGIEASGTLSKTFLRTNTAGGQPPDSCNPSDKSVLTVPYAALYAFYL